MATYNFEVAIGDSSLTQTSASIYAAFVTTEAFPEDWQTLSIYYQDEQGVGHTKTFQPTTLFPAIGAFWEGYSLTGLSPGTTYEYLAYLGTSVPTVSTPAATGSFTTRPQGGDATPYVYRNGAFVQATPYVYAGGWKKADAKIF